MKKTPDHNDQPPAEPPAHLSPEMKTFWRSVVERKNLQLHELLLLGRALEAFDRAEQAREVLGRLGCTYDDRFGQPRARPEIGIERDARAQFAKLLKQINLHDPFAQ